MACTIHTLKLTHSRGGLRRIAMERENITLRSKQNNVNDSYAFDTPTAVCNF